MRIEKMLVWIDGTYGVGKTAVIKQLKEIIPCSEIEILESDIYIQEMLTEIVEEAKKTNSFPAFSGTLPQTDTKFIERFRRIIQEKLTLNKIVIVDMTLTHDESKKGLYEFFLTENVRTLHIILTASEEIIRERIKNDNTRDKLCALENLKYNISFLNQNYQDAIRINTDSMSIADTANEIAQHISNMRSQL